MTKEEVWKDIEGYEGLYQVSDKCHVMSVERTYIGGYGAICKTGGKMLKIQENAKRSNRKYVILCKDGKTKTHYISNLVARAFIPNPNNYPEVDHINGDPTDDRLDNYRWVDRKMNMNNPNTKNKISNGTSKEVREKRKLRMIENNPAKHYTEEWRKKLSIVRAGVANDKCWKRVAQYDLENNLVAEYSSITEASKQTNNKICQISAAATGRQKTCGGYIWKYITV